MRMSVLADANFRISIRIAFLAADARPTPECPTVSRASSSHCRNPESENPAGSHPAGQVAINHHASRSTL